MASAPMLATSARAKPGRDAQRTRCTGAHSDWSSSVDGAAMALFQTCGVGACQECAALNIV